MLSCDFHGKLCYSIALCALNSCSHAKLHFTSRVLHGSQTYVINDYY